MFPRDKDKVQIQIYKIKNKGDKHFELKIDTKLPVITIGEPVNSFERGILESYSKCRAESLRKYFPMLSDESIKILLQDNYLQKKDFKNYVQ